MQHSKEQSAKRGKRYSCKFCHEKYDMEPKEYKIRSLRNQALYKQCCTSELCEEQARSFMASKALKTDAKRKRDLWKKEKQVIKNNLGIKPAKQSQDLLQKQVNKIARLIDKDRRCLARPNETQKQPLEGGHIFSVGSYPSLRYHLWNIHGQSHKSNAILGGEPQLMLDGIERRYGIEKRNDVEDLKKRYPVLKMTKTDKTEAASKARKIIKEIETGKVYARDEVNEILGIYK